MRPSPNPAPARPLKTSFLLACAWRLSVEEPGEGAVRLGRPLVPSHPSSAATPNPRSAQRAPGPTTHLPARPGLGGGRGRRALGSAQVLRMPDRGEGRDRERRARTPAPSPGGVGLASRQWTRGARARVRARGVSVRAPGMCGTLGVTGSGAARPFAATSFWFWHSFFLGHLGKSATQGDGNVGARASGSVGGRVFCVACAPAQVGSSHPAVTIPMGPRTSSLWFRVPELGRRVVQIPCTVHRPPSGRVGSRDALFGGQ